MNTPAKIVRITDLESERNNKLQKELESFGERLKELAGRLLDGKQEKYYASDNWIAEQMKRAYESTGDYEIERIGSALVLKLKNHKKL